MNMYIHIYLSLESRPSFSCKKPSRIQEKRETNFLYNSYHHFSLTMESELVQADVDLASYLPFLYSILEVHAIGG